MEVENKQNISEEKCKICGRLLSEYDPSWSCKKNHHWKRNWVKNASPEKIEHYKKKRNESMKKSWRKWLDKLNKKTPPEYASRRGSKALEEVTIIKRKRNQYRSVTEKDIKI